MSGAEWFSNTEHINPYYGDGGVDVAQAAREHKTIAEAFREAGIKVVKVPAPERCQDGVYTANWGLAIEGKAIMSRLPSARKAEELYARGKLAELGYEVIEVPEGLKFSGQGDCLPCGKYLLAGSGYRSDEDAQKFAAEIMGLKLVQLRAIPEIDERDQPVINAASGWADSFFYDIDLALAVVREDLIAYCPEAFVPESREKIEELPMEKIVVSYKEATEGFACNLVSTGKTVVMSGDAPELRAELECRGIKVITPKVEELKKGGGYIRCVSLALG